jgi:hypothetical protein
MRKNITIFVNMAHNKTETYQKAKNVFTTLGLKEDVYLDIRQDDIKIFRKHLSEMIKRQQSANKYATRLINDRVKVIRIQ